MFTKTVAFYETEIFTQMFIQLYFIVGNDFTGIMTQY